MKTKNEVVAVVAIAIICSMLLVALTATAIAAEQTTQGVSAAEVTTASEDEYVLDIYGNANEDDTIDMRDVTYTKLVIFGKKPETELADAYYDGEVDVLDVVQVKLIILGRESELTLIDSADRIVTVKKPIERVITLYIYQAEAIRMLGVQDKIVGVSESIRDMEIYFPELSKLSSVGGWMPDYEAILCLNPDLVIGWSYSAAEHAEKLPSIAVIGFDFYKEVNINEEVMKLSYIFGKRDEAEHYIDEFHDKYIDLIKMRTEGLTEEERPKVYLEGCMADYETYGRDSYTHVKIDIAGGRNIFADLEGGSYIEIEAEEVAWRSPDIIIKYVSTGYCGIEKDRYEADNPSELKAMREEIMNRPELAEVDAVKNGKVYIMYVNLNNGPGYPIATAHWAKWFHPELFEDLDSKAIHQEYLTELQRLDYDLDEHGVFVYHPEEHPDGH